MHAVRVHEFGGPEVLRYEELPTPIPEGADALVKIEASGVNYVDIYQREGLYKTTLPFTAGSEAAGVVAAVGPKVEDVRVGDRIAYAGPLGAYATHAVVAAARLVKLPDALEFRQGAAVMLQGITAHYLSHSTYALKAGDAALVHAAAGGVGLLLVQMARIRGARVIGTVSTEEKAAIAKSAGADDVIQYTTQDFESEVRRLTYNRGVDVVYDSVGKTTYEKSMNCLVPRGMLVLYGNASGPVPPIDPLLLAQKGALYLTRPTMGPYIATRQELLSRADDIMRWIASGRLTLRIDRTFPLEAAADAHRALASRATSGKLLLIPH